MLLTIKVIQNTIIRWPWSYGSPNYNFENLSNIIDKNCKKKKFNVSI